MANRVLCIEIGNRMTHVVETDFKVKEPKIYKSFSFQTPDNLFKEETLADVLPFKERLDAGLEEHKILSLIHILLIYEKTDHKNRYNRL